MGRPPGYQWEPLGLDTDPVPGDPQRISEEGAHLASVAKQITSQVAVLRKMASDGVQVGKTPDVIKSSASDLADQLDKVVGRYQKVSAALTGWVPELEQAQRMSIQALDQAEVPYQKIKQTVVLPSGNNLTAQQKQDVTNYHNSMTKAQDELDAAKALLNRATGLRDSSGSSTAAKINSAIGDGMKDSWWDKFKDFVSHYAWLIKDICTALEVLATILAVIALFIPGLDIVAALLWIGFALTAGALLGRVMLAATGNGSWFDVAMDAIALLTFGVGKFATGALKALAESSETLGKSLVQGERTLMMAKSMQFLEKGADLFDDQSLARIVVKQVGNVEKLAPEVGELSGKLPLAARFALRLAGASPEDFGNLGKTFALAQRFAGNPAVAGILSSGKLFTTVLGINAGTNLLTGVGVPAIGGLELDGPNGDPLHLGSIPLKIGLPDSPVTHIYNKIEDGTTTSGGLTTTQADALANIATLPFPPANIAFNLATGNW
jgi:hypothetical protein